MAQKSTKTTLQASFQRRQESTLLVAWIPAFAGMTHMKLLSSFVTIPGLALLNRLFNAQISFLYRWVVLQLLCGVS